MTGTLLDQDVSQSKAIEPKGPMRLLELRMRNFKGQADFTFTPGGKDASVYAANGVGKTTIADAFYYLLFDKNSLNSKDFDIKTIDPKTGEAIHGLDHEVYGEFEIGGDTTSFQKTYKEDWVKKRGGATSEFSGHTTVYKVNGVPVQKKEYDEWLRGICDEKLFRLLSDPTYFSIHLPWQERRKILIEICGDVSDADVIAMSSKLADLPAILGRHKMEDYRKIIAARRKEVNEEIGKIPVRIDELNRSIGTSTPAAPTNLDELRKELEALGIARAQITSGGEVAEKTKQLREIEAQILDATTAARSAAMAGTEGTREAYSLAVSAVLDCERSISFEKRTIDEKQAAHERLGNQLVALRQSFQAENAKTFTFAGTDTCGACGQSLPIDKVEAARAKAEAQFNEVKSAKLEANRSEGKDVSGRYNSLLAEIQTSQETLAGLESKLAELVLNRDSLKDQAQPKEPDLSTDPTLCGLANQKLKVEKEISDLRGNSTESLAENSTKQEELSAKIQAGEKVRAEIASREQSEKRISELKERERELAVEIEKIDREIFLTEDFIRTKVKAITAKVNSRFEIATFKLFETQINGAISECCEPTINGRPYSSALSNSEKINVGLDIINVLADHYEFSPVIFIDNCESVSDPLPTRGQQVRLVVSKPDKALRVEIAA